VKPLPQKKVVFISRYISDQKKLAERMLKNTMNDITKKTNPPCAEISRHYWTMLRIAFRQRLEVLELQRRCRNAKSWSSAEEVEIHDLAKAMLRAESKFGGVSEEALIRVLRAAYPKVAERLLPRTAMDMWQEYNHPAKQYIRDLEADLDSDACRELLEGVLTESAGSTAESASSEFSVSRPSTGNTSDGSRETSIGSFYSWSPDDPRLGIPSFDSFNSRAGLVQTAKMY
jgi:lambda repressor-like predicted transcriptional regulator